MKKVLFPIILLLLLVACEKDQLAPASDQDLTATVDTRDVNEAITLVNDLITKVDDMMDQGLIGHGPGTSILSKLNSINDKLERGQVSVALSKLDALLEHLEGLFDEGSLDFGIAEGLIFDVETIACEANPDCERLDMLKATINTGTGTYTLYVHPDNQRVSGVNPVIWGGTGHDTELFNYSYPLLGKPGTFPDYTAARNAALTDFNGFDNTAVIVTELDAIGEPDYAAKVCADLEAGGYSDWYLPAMGELMPMLNQLGGYGENNFNASLFWSSTEFHDGAAWRPYCNINPTTQKRTWVPWTAGKWFNSGSCRCVRKWNR